MNYNSTNHHHNYSANQQTNNSSSYYVSHQIQHNIIAREVVATPDTDVSGFVNPFNKVNKMLTKNAVQNILNSPFRIYQDNDRDGKFNPKGNDGLNTYFKTGVYYSFGLRMIL
mgnify:CR=1 FL=1